MFRTALVIVLMSVPAMAETKPQRKVARPVIDACAPIGQLADGTLVYSMQCANLPTAPQAQAAPEPQVQRGGLFGLSYNRRRPDE